jgi:hypothetical protein
MERGLSGHIVPRSNTRKIGFKLGLYFGVFTGFIVLPKEGNFHCVYIWHMSESSQSLSSSSSSDGDIAVPTAYTTEYRQEAELGDTYAKEEEHKVLGFPKRRFTKLLN